MVREENVINEQEQTLRKLLDKCEKCHPSTPLACTTGCNIWKLKNEHRKLLDRIRGPSYVKNLLNTLKNDRRLEVLEFLGRTGQSVEALQQQMRMQGYEHSQQTIIREYIEPLVETGLADEEFGKFRITSFGTKLSGLVKELEDSLKSLPPHSECHEEAVMSMLLVRPRTFDELSAQVSARSIPRILGRLQKVRLVMTDAENEYVFFFRSKRDPKIEQLTSTEEGVHQAMPAEGISARKLAERTGLSLRRTYRCTRRLKGKKLVFTRIKPKTYSLTNGGVLLAIRLNELNRLVEEALVTANTLVKGRVEINSETTRNNQVECKGKENIVSLTTQQAEDQN